MGLGSERDSFGTRIKEGVPCPVPVVHFRQTRADPVKEGVRTGSLIALSYCPPMSTAGHEPELLRRIGLCGPDLSSVPSRDPEFPKRKCPDLESGLSSDLESGPLAKVSGPDPSVLIHRDTSRPDMSRPDSVQKLSNADGRVGRKFGRAVRQSSFQLFWHKVRLGTCLKPA